MTTGRHGTGAHTEGLTADDLALIDYLTVQTNSRIAGYVADYIQSIRAEQPVNADMLAALKPFAAFALAREDTWKDRPDDTSYFGKKPVGFGTVIQVIHQSGQPLPAPPGEAAPPSPEDETIRNYTGSNPAIKDAVLEIESFIGDMENAELVDASAVDASDAARSLHILINALNAPPSPEIERIVGEIERTVNDARFSDEYVGIHIRLNWPALRAALKPTREQP